MKIFVTGGTGFIGKFVVSELLKHGHEVLILTRRKYQENRNIKLVIGNLTKPKIWLSAIKKFQPDVTIHLAWEGIPDFSAEMCAKNINQSLNLFIELQKIGCKKIITSGSCFEYGAGIKGKLKENTVPGPLSIFASSKRAIQLVGQSFVQTHNLKFIWLRLFYVYGPGQRKESLIPSLINSKKHNLPPSIKNPKAENDFVYVGDVAEAIIKTVEKKNVPSGIFNIGSGKLTSVGFISDLIYGNLPKKPKTKIENGIYADTTFARKFLCWKPKTSIENGIRKTINP